MLCLNLSWWRSLSYRNQSFDLLYKSMDWFLYDRDSVMKESINIHILMLLFNLYAENKILTFVNTNEDQICSPEKYSLKNLYNKNKFYLNEKNIYDQNISYWIQTYFDWMKIYFDILEKRWYNENIFYWIQICFDWMKIYFDIM